MCRVCIFYYNPPYYESRDLERYEFVKESEEKTLGKSLEQIGQEKAQKYLKYKDIVKTEEQLEQEKKKLEETLKKLETEERQRHYGKRSNEIEIFTPLFLPLRRGE
ncbi:MAG TPA: hypothetical protein ACFYEF_14690 [Candidatus Wunengus sp. YC63]|uniref:hypothetical protein n=1 Tax=Candidatus Wunengus sp. YC63 TaxID=3367699 RepID=UPI004029B9FD